MTLSRMLLCPEPLSVDPTRAGQPIVDGIGKFLDPDR